MTSTIDKVRQRIAACSPADLFELRDKNLTTTILYGSELAILTDTSINVGTIETQWTTADLHLRSGPTFADNILMTIPASTPVALLDIVPVDSSGILWVYIETLSMRGWVASQYLSKNKRRSIGHAGIHVLQDGWAAAVGMAQSVPIACATVISDVEAALTLAKSIKAVIWRPYPDPAVPMPLPSDPQQAQDAGRAAVERVVQQGLPFSNSAIYVQIVNENDALAADPQQANFWLGVMLALESHGMKAAIGAYSVGTPEVAQWQALAPALEYAASHGHIVALHAYTDPNAAPGCLSAADQTLYWEARFIRLYNSVAANARPPLVLSEFGTYNAVFPGTENLISMAAAFEQLVAQYPYVIGYCLWTIGGLGGWQKSDITAAIPALEAWIGKR